MNASVTSMLTAKIESDFFVVLRQVNKPASASCVVTVFFCHKFLGAWFYNARTGWLPVVFTRCKVIVNLQKYQYFNKPTWPYPSGPVKSH